MKALPFTAVALALVAFAQDPDESARERARAAIGRGAFDEAAAALGPGDEAVLGDLLREAGHPKLALPYYRRVLERDPDDVPSSVGLGHALTDLGRYEEAAAALAPAAGGGSAEAQSAMGYALVRGGDVLAGLATLRTAAEQNAGDQSDKARELHQYFLERHRDEVEWAAVRGEEARAQGDWPDAARLLLGYALALGDRPEEALAGARAALAAGDDPEKALRGFLAALEAEPAVPLRAQAHAGCGAARLMLDDPDGARRDFAAAIDLMPDDPESLFGSALALARLGLFGEAADHLRKALASADPELRQDLLHVARGEQVFSGDRADPRLRDIVEQR
jgi:tetratricopeptide (TPR) repeat protein